MKPHILEILHDCCNCLESTIELKTLNDMLAMGCSNQMESSKSSETSPASSGFKYPNVKQSKGGRALCDRRLRHNELGEIFGSPKAKCPKQKNELRCVCVCVFFKGSGITNTNYYHVCSDNE